MGHRRDISDDQKRMIVTMSGRLKASDIAEVTGISQSSVRRTLRLWQATGEVSRRSHITGRPRSLTGVEATVMLYSCMLYIYIDLLCDF